MYVVYGLVNPLTHQVFYVGMTKDMYTRYIQHLNMDGSNKVKDEVILTLKKRNIVPEIRALAVAYDVNEAKRLEAFHIEKERLLQQPLANQTHWTGYKQLEWEKEELISIARQIYQERKPPKGLFGFIYKYLKPYLIGKTLYDNHFAKKPAMQIDRKKVNPAALRMWEDITKRLREGEEPVAIVESYIAFNEPGALELNAVVNMMAAQINEEE